MRLTKAVPRGRLRRGSALQGLLVLSICLSPSAVAQAAEDFASYRQQAVAPHREDFERIAVRLVDDSDFKAFTARLDVVDALAERLVASFEASRRRTGRQLLDGVVPPSAVDAMDDREAVDVRSAAELVREHEAKFAEALPVPRLNADELNVLRAYYDAAVRAAAAWITRNGATVARIDDEAAASVVSLCCVVPFLHVADAHWNVERVRDLPAWIREPKYLEMLERFALDLRRPRTAYAFAETRMGDTVPAYWSYQEQVAEKLVETETYHSAIVCLRAGVEDAAEHERFDEAVRLRLRLGALLAELGHPLMAVDQMERVLAESKDDATYRRAAVLRFKHLYEAGAHKRVVDDLDAFLEDERCRRARPQIMYVGWVAHRRRLERGAADRLMKRFLAEYENHVLAADMYYASAVDALVRSDYAEAARLLELIEFRFPEARVIEKVQRLQARLNGTTMEH
ncbi:MAG: hypothetical protein CMJ18_04580 [Phycisphaeraceae bacterium]|nr:hypothetical protein [Phycisphaeraceae bacterium]